MPWLGTITLVGLVVLAALIWVFLRLRSGDRVQEVLEKNRSTARACTRANLLEGMAQIPVALVLTADTLFYENRDLQASIEVPMIEEVEYDDETATGHTVAGKVLRIRAHNHAFEFMMDLPTARTWEAVMPARRVDHAKAM